MNLVVQQLGKVLAFLRVFSCQLPVENTTSQEIIFEGCGYQRANNNADNNENSIVEASQVRQSHPNVVSNAFSDLEFIINDNVMTISSHIYQIVRSYFRIA